MSRRITSIHLPKAPGSPGVAKEGEQTVEVMIKELREYAAHLRAEAEAVEAAADHEFQIESYNGVFVQRGRRELQSSSRFNPDF